MFLFFLLDLAKKTVLLTTFLELCLCLCVCKKDKMETVLGANATGLHWEFELPGWAQNDWILIGVGSFVATNAAYWGTAAVLELIMRVGNCKSSAIECTRLDVPCLDMVPFHRTCNHCVVFEC